MGVLDAARWVVAAVVLTCAGRAATAPAVAAPSSNITFTPDQRLSVPWSIHVVRVPRLTGDYQLAAAHAHRRAIGLSSLSAHASTVSPSMGVPVAGINGDFYQRGGSHAGDPRGLQIIDGELISGPAGTAAFWIDAEGEPHTSIVNSLFQVVWPDGSRSSMGLNGERRSNLPELYTPAVGPSTRTSGGREFLLEAADPRMWLPLAAGQTYRCRVREIRDGGDSPLDRRTLVLSVSGGLARRLPAVAVGDTITISTLTSPSLKGARTAIGGGPVLVQGGKSERVKVTEDDSYESSSMFDRHPRSAVGWNDATFFLVEVDGRQRGWSVGMTLKELAAYMVELGCTEAMNLDGGGSATLWYAGRVRNQPCDGRERPVANSLWVVKRRPAAPKSEAPPTARQAPEP